jgi:type IV pilus assembly protein PilW
MTLARGGRQSGFTIVELMVALAVGLIVIAGVGQVFVANKQAFRYIDGVSALQEQANYALDFVASQAGAAGLFPNPYNFGLNDVAKKSMEQSAYGATPPVDGVEGGADSDKLIINTIPTKLPLVDCTGSATAADFNAPAGPGIRNTLEIKTGASGQPALFCNDVEIVEGIENMQVLYGRATTDAAGQTVVQYFARDQITDNDELADVVNVRIALLVSTPQEARSGENPDNSFDLLGTTVDATADRRLRKVFTTTIQLRNRCHAVSRTSGATLCA